MAVIGGFIIKSGRDALLMRTSSTGLTKGKGDSLTVKDVRVKNLIGKESDT